MTLKDDIASDAGTFYDTDEFGETVEYNGVSISAVDESLADQVRNTVAAPVLQLLVSAADVVQPEIDDRVIYKGTRYRVAEGSYLTGLDWSIPLIRDYIEV